jgi:two-component system sensor histidine kinase/response regulator
MIDHPAVAQGDILIVDDTPANLVLLSQILRARGYKVRPVPSGPLALDAAQAAPPDLVLLDVNLPEMSGYEVCERLKVSERTRDVPILFISALDNLDSKVKAFKAGGVDYITKPFQVEEVTARVATHLTLRQLQKQMQSINADLQTRNAELDTFAHTVAHDLKNALNTIMGHAELLEADLDTLALESIRTSVHAVARMSHKMNNIVEELMLLAGVRQQLVTLQPLDMAASVAEAYQRIEYLVNETQAKIVFPTQWPVAYGYGPWIEEVWVNYLSNAIKYGGTSSTPPQIEIGVTLQPDGFARFWVHDNGRGIKPEDQSRLFSKFERLDEVHATGHGLGLSIVKHIIDKLGGQVGVESKGLSGHGSTFYFTLPVR